MRRLLASDFEGLASPGSLVSFADLAEDAALASAGLVEGFDSGFAAALGADLGAGFAVSLAAGLAGAGLAANCETRLQVAPLTAICRRYNELAARWRFDSALRTVL